MQVPAVSFEPFDKIPRLRRDCVITEKIDGTNGCIYITEEGDIHAASRTRWITPEQDNQGFARWVEQNAADLQKLGPGQHFGEWWGAGIQRRYGLVEKRFSLFNSSRWGHIESRPECCGVVPVLHAGVFSDEAVSGALDQLRSEGSVAAPGFMNPEGVVIYLSASRSLFKVMLVGDEIPKTAVA